MDSKQSHDDGARRQDKKRQRDYTFCDSAPSNEEELQQMIAELQRQIKEKDNTIKEKDNKDNTIKEKDNTIKEKDNMIKERIEEKDNMIKEKEMTIEEKEKKIKEKEKTIEEKDNTIKEKEKTIEEKDTAIKEKEITIKEKEQTIEEKEKRLNECRETSLQKLLLLKNSERLSVIRTGSDSSNVQNNHGEAEAREKPFTLSEIDHSNLKEYHQSRLLLDFKKGPRSVTTEADVVSLIGSALWDALELVGVIHDDCGLDVRMERSFFSCRPDILVVNSHRYNIPLLAIEVKKDSVALVTEKKVLGQVFDYATMLAAFGHKTPFVILSSFRESCVCWLDNEESSKLASSTDSRYALADTGSLPSKKPDGNEKTASPHLLKTVSTDSDDSKSNEFCKQGNRTLIRSKIYSAHELVPLLYSSILCSLKGFGENPPSEIFLWTKDKRIKVPAVRMTPKTYTWGMLQTTIGAPITSRKHPSRRSERINQQEDCLDTYDDQAYYVIGDAGNGLTSKAFHALDASGEEVVLKMFVKTTNQEGSTLDLASFNDLAKEQTDREFANLKKLYPELASRFHKVVLNTLPCIVMPFFKPVKKQDRKSALHGIRSVLEEKFTPHQLMYKDDDVRWRDVGTIDGNYVLFDVADLDEVTTENFVEDHIAMFTKRMKESFSTARGFLPVDGAAVDDKARIEIHRKS